MQKLCKIPLTPCNSKRSISSLWQGLNFLRAAVLLLSILISAAIAEFNVGVLAGTNLLSGKIAVIRTTDNQGLYKTPYNLRLFSAGVSAGYDWFLQSLMLGADISWIYNQKGWHEISQISDNNVNNIYDKISTQIIHQYGVGIRVGYVNEKFIPYLRLGIEQIPSKIRLFTIDILANVSRHYEQTKSKLAFTTAIGFEYKTFDNFWLRFEGRYLYAKADEMKYNSYTYASDATFTLKHQRLLLTAGLIYRF